jgi:hypothetical protein
MKDPIIGQFMWNEFVVILCNVLGVIVFIKRVGENLLRRLEG